MSGASITTDLPLPRSAMAIGAHPDDIDLGCGATLAKWAAGGCDVHYLVLTDGARGSWNGAVSGRSLAALRETEQRRAAGRVGAAGVNFCGWVDGELRNGRHERWMVSRMIRQLRPEVVLGHDPWRRYRLHPDHRNAGFLMTDSIVAARDPLFFPDQGYPPHRPESLLLWEADAPNHVERVAGFGLTKVYALLAHTSQYETTMRILEREGEVGIDDPEAAWFRQRVLGQLAEHGALASTEPGEAFHLTNEI